MIQIKDAVKTSASLVLKLDDFVTGYAVTNTAKLRVVSGDGLLIPVIKPDGYVVFTSRKPDEVIIQSDLYENAQVETRDFTGTVLRLSLIPRFVRGRTLNINGETHVAFTGNDGGYAAASAVSPEKTEIALIKEDLRDVTEQYCAVLTQNGAEEALYITKNLGGGRYTVSESPVRSYQTRGTRFLPLSRVVNNTVPVPDGAKTALLLSDGELKAINLEDES